MIGSTLSHFKIIAKLGEGGMGEVYRAEDQNLKREVALKVLPPEVAGNSERLERFQREAEAVAALNHPNIVTIYSVEKADGVQFLTMELIDGESLDEVLHRGSLPMPRALEISNSIADALSAAHDRGIVHRDLKPANVMLTSDGRVKVLDFGLAKLTDEGSESFGDHTAEMPTEVKPLTEEGVVMGTAPYMSPEQAQGKPVDARSDIFSLGGILYEAATGTRAFQGESSIDTLHKVIYEQPQPLEERIPTAPLQLQWILRKALAKEPGDRYQSARDLAVDLRATSRDLESDPNLATLTSGRVTPIQAQPKQSRKGVVAAAVIAVAVIGAFSWLLGRRSGLDSSADASQQISIRPVTASGLVIVADISPDGKYVAYVESYQGEQGLYLRQIDGTQRLELTPPDDVAFWGTTFTPDGTGIVYGQKAQGYTSGALFHISTLGGTPRRVGTHVDSAVSFSPDGSQFAWLRARFPDPEQSSIMIANSDGSEERLLLSETEPVSLAPRFHTGLSWSPDGSLIAATIWSSETGIGQVVAYSADDGTRVWTSEQSWSWLSKVQWLPDGKSLLLVADPDVRPDAQIWIVPYPKGTPRAITNDMFDYRVLGLTSDGQKLLTIPTEFESHMWSFSLSEPGPPGRISGTKFDGYYGFDFTPDGRVVFQTLDRGKTDLGIMNADGSERTLITNDTDDDRFPQVTPDGRVVYVSLTPNGPELRVSALDGSQRQTLANFVSLRSFPAISPDSQSVIVRRVIDGKGGLWRVPLNGGQMAQVIDYEAFDPAISNDGTRLAFLYHDLEQEAFKVGVTSIDGGEREAEIDGVQFSTQTILRWADGDEALLTNFVAGDRANIWRFPLDGSQPVRLTDFPDQRAVNFDYSPDGKALVVARGILTRDAVLIENFQ
jgi:serine/threonine protein kinase